MIPRYAPREMASLFTDEARFAMWLQVELLAIDGWVLVGDVPAEAAEVCRSSAPVVDAAFVAGGRRPRAGDRPRRGRLRGRRPGRDRCARGVLDPLRPHLLRRRRHRPVRHAHPGLRPPHRGGDRAGPGPRAPGAGVDRRPGDRQDPRHARRADHLRSQVRALGAPGRPRPAAPPGGARAGGGGQALRCGGHLLQHRSEGRGTRVPRPRTATGPGDPGRRPRPARRVPLGVRLGRGDHRAHRDRDPSPGPQRAGRGGGAVPVGPEGELGHAAQAQPRPLRTAVRPGPRPTRVSLRRPRGRRPLARAGHLAQLGGAGGPPGRQHAHLLHAHEGHRSGRGPRAAPRTGAGHPHRGPATAWCSASRSSSPW